MIRILEETGTVSTIEITLVADVVGVIFSPDYFKELGLQVVDDQTVVQIEKTVEESIVGGRSKSKRKSAEVKEAESEELKELEGDQEITYPYRYFYNAFEAFNDGNFSLKSLFKRKKASEEDKKGFFGSLFDKKEEEKEVPVTTPAGPGIFSSAVSITPIDGDKKVIVEGENTYLDKMKDALTDTKTADEAKEQGKGGKEGKEEVPLEQKTYLEKMQDALMGSKTADEVKEEAKEEAKEEVQSETAKEVKEVKEEGKEEEKEKPGFFQGFFGGPPPPKANTAQVKLQVFGNILKKKDYDAKKEECKADPNNIEASPIDGKTQQETNSEARDTGKQWRHKEKFLNALSDDEKYQVKLAYDALPKDDDAHPQIFYVYVDKDDKVATVLDFRLFKEE